MDKVYLILHIFDKTKSPSPCHMAKLITPQASRYVMVCKYTMVNGLYTIIQTNLYFAMTIKSQKHLFPIWDEHPGYIELPNAINYVASILASHQTDLSIDVVNYLMCIICGTHQVKRTLSMSVLHRYNLFISKISLLVQLLSVYSKPPNLPVIDLRTAQVYCVAIFLTCWHPSHITISFLL